MAAPCLGVVGTFQYSAPRCKKQHEVDTDAGHPAVTRLPAEEDPQARCDAKGGVPDELVDICPKCSDEVVWVRKRIDVSQSAFSVNNKLYATFTSDTCSPDTS